MTFGETKPTMREKKQRIQKWILGTTFRAILACIVVVCGVLYVVQVSAISSKGYDIADLQKEIDTLEREHERLAVEIAKHQSMASIEERLSSLEFVATSDIEYIQPLGSIVARR